MTTIYESNNSSAIVKCKNTTIQVFTKYTTKTLSISIIRVYRKFFLISWLTPLILFLVVVKHSLKIMKY